MTWNGTLNEILFFEIYLSLALISRMAQMAFALEPAGSSLPQVYREHGQAHFFTSSSTRYLVTAVAITAVFSHIWVKGTTMPIMTEVAPAQLC